MTIMYIEDADVASVLDSTIDNLKSVLSGVQAGLQVAEGLRHSALAYDPKSLVMVAELVSTVRDEAAQLNERLVVDLFYAEGRPVSVNEIARVSGMSVTKVNSLAAAAEAIPED